jgi:hypothetical protein
MWPREDA